MVFVLVAVRTEFLDQGIGGARVEMASAAKIEGRRFCQ